MPIQIMSNLKCLGYIFIQCFTADALDKGLSPLLYLHQTDGCTQLF